MSRGRRWVLGVALMKKLSYGLGGLEGPVNKS